MRLSLAMAFEIQSLDNLPHCLFKGPSMILRRISFALSLEEGVYVERKRVEV
jgi:hypothetical protein